jgi:hypothetical protein
MVHHMHRILKQALQQAVRWEMLPRNPADAVDPPKVEKRPMITYGLPETVDGIAAMRFGYVGPCAAGGAVRREFRLRAYRRHAFEAPGDPAGGDLEHIWK